MAMAPTLTMLPSSPNQAVGSPKQFGQVAGPAAGHHRRAERELQQQVPADDPGDDLAHGRVRVGVGAAGGRHAGGQFGVAEGGEQGDQRRRCANEITTAGPALSRASMPVRVKIPVPMTMPMPKPVRSIGAEPALQPVAVARRRRRPGRSRPRSAWSAAATCSTSWRGPHGPRPPVLLPRRVVAQPRLSRGRVPPCPAPPTSDFPTLGMLSRVADSGKTRTSPGHSDRLFWNCGIDNIDQFPGPPRRCR